MIEYNSFDSDNSSGLSAKSFFKYDEKGNMIEGDFYMTYMSNSSLIEKSIYKYNDKGNEIERNHYKSDSSLGDNDTYKYDYDKTGNWLKKTEFKNNVPQTIIVHEIVYY
jgi:replication-associated recombination protein RarA